MDGPRAEREHEENRNREMRSESEFVARPQDIHDGSVEGGVTQGKADGARELPQRHGQESRPEADMLCSHVKARVSLRD